ncbi:MAG: hypothetical protein J6Z49_11550 [Kiritimatiellae bacterium]|nr:hypothetical protein [Kiritimatiellia bacterium]
MAEQKHFTYAELDAFLHGDLPVLKRLRCQLHLHGCPQCQGLLQHVEEDNRLLEDGLMRSLDAYKKENDAKT